MDHWELEAWSTEASLLRETLSKEKVCGFTVESFFFGFSYYVIKNFIDETCRIRIVNLLIKILFSNSD